MHRLVQFRRRTLRGGDAPAGVAVPATMAVFFLFGLLAMRNWYRTWRGPTAVTSFLACTRNWLHRSCHRRL
jgi:hypothetical protein